MDSFPSPGMAGPRSWRGRPWSAPVSGGVPGPAGGAAGRDGPYRPAAGGPGLSGGGLRAWLPGGGLYAVQTPHGRAALCAEGMESGELLVKELLCPPEDLDWVVERLPGLLPRWSSAWRTPEGTHHFGMLKWLDPELERSWDWSSTAYLGLAFD